MVKVSPEKGFRTPLGSLRSLRVSPPVLTIVAVTLRFPSPSKLASDVETLTFKPGAVDIPGAAEPAAAQATRVMKGVRREENIRAENGTEGGRRDETKGLNGPGFLNRLQALKASCACIVHECTDRP